MILAEDAARMRLPSTAELGKVHWYALPSTIGGHWNLSFYKLL